MRSRLVCETRFDITRTDIRGHYRPADLPRRDRQDQWIHDHAAWLRARNQQRNFETLLQIISLRTLPDDISDPVCDHGRWSFSFWVPDITSVAWGADAVGALKYDAHGVPMIRGLGESADTDDVVHCYGPDINVWFSWDQGK